MTVSNGNLSQSVGERSEGCVGVVLTYRQLSNCTNYTLKSYPVNFKEKSRYRQAFRGVYRISYINPHVDYMELQRIPNEVTVIISTSRMSGILTFYRPLYVLIPDCHWRPSGSEAGGSDNLH